MRWMMVSESSFVPLSVVEKRAHRIDVTSVNVSVVGDVEDG